MWPTDSICETGEVKRVTNNEKSRSGKELLENKEWETWISCNK